MGQCVVRVVLPVALCATTTVVFSELSKLEPLPDRLAVIPENETRIDNVRPFDAKEKWAVDGAQAGLHRLNPARVAYFDKRIRSLGMRPPFRVLDAGCGGGLVSNALAGLPGYFVQGVDMSREALRFAEETAVSANLTSVEFRQGSIYALPFANESFDAVIVSDVLEHLLDLPSALAESARVLRPGGVLLFDTIDRTWSSYIVAILGAERIVGIVLPNSHDWRLFIRPKELKSGLERSGFHSFFYESFDPTLLSLLELTLMQFGLLRPQSMRGGWNIGQPSLVMVSYIGQAVKSGRPKAPTHSAAARSRDGRASPPDSSSSSSSSSTAPAGGPAVEVKAEEVAAEPAVAEAAARRELAEVALDEGSPSAGDGVAEDGVGAETPGPQQAASATSGGASASSGGASASSGGANASGGANTSSSSRNASLDGAASAFASRAGVNASRGGANASTDSASATRGGANASRGSASAPRGGASPSSGGADASRGGTNRSAGSTNASEAARQGQAAGSMPLLPPPAVPRAGAEASAKGEAAAAAKYRYKVGDEVELKISAGPAKGSWVRGHVRALADKPDWYFLHLPAMPPADRDISWSIPASAIRTFKATAFTHKVGDAVEIQAEAGPLKGTWLAGKVINLGTLAETYDIAIRAPNSSVPLNVPAVPVMKLRKAVQKTEEKPLVVKYKAGEAAEIRSSKDGKWTPCTVAAPGKHPDTYDVWWEIRRPPGWDALKNVPWHVLRKRPTEAPKPPAQPPKPISAEAKALEAWKTAKGDFQAGERCHLLSNNGPKKGQWSSCTIAGKGIRPDTYDVRIPRGQAGKFETIHAVPARLLASAEAARLFKVGEMAEVKVFKGKAMGQWVQCIVTGQGKGDANRYNIHVLSSAPEGSSEIRNVSAYALRRKANTSDHSMPSWAAKALEATKLAQAADLPKPQHFEAGEVALIRIRDGPQEGSWTPCMIVRNGTVPGSYDIRIDTGKPPGHLNISSVPGVALKKAEQKAFQVFEVGSQVEMEVKDGPFKGAWVRCLILARQAAGNTYDIRLMGLPIPDAVVLNAVPASHLRELPKDAPVLPPPQDKPAAPLEQSQPEAPSVSFQEGETAEVRASESWVRCIIGEKGAYRNTYNIRVVSDNTDGYLDVPNVPVHKLRKSEKPSRIAIFMWVLEIVFSMR